MQGKDYLARALKFREENPNSPESIRLFEQIIEYFPGSESAEQAQAYLYNLKSRTEASNPHTTTQGTSFFDIIAIVTVVAVVGFFIVLYFEHKQVEYDATAGTRAAQQEIDELNAKRAGKIPTETRSLEASDGSYASDTLSFDTITYCRNVSKAVGGSYQIEAACRDQERQSPR